MSSAPPPAPPAAPPTRQADPPNEITIVSHSSLFYWWPVWAIGFLFALLSSHWVSGNVMAIVPDDSEARRNWRVETAKDTYETREGILVKGDDKHHLLPSEKVDGKLPEPEQPHLNVSASKNLGVVFAIVLLLVIIITNVPLRGMWSLVVIITVIMLSIIFALAGWWETIISFFRILDIRINMGGYLVISTGLFIVWILCFVFFDRQIYITFTPGQFKVRTEIGGGEQVYDAMGLTLERQRSDLFRHWIIGLGSGDLIVKTTGAQAHHFDLPNVLFINKKAQKIEEVIKSRKVVEPH
jgi:hypothetical protein